MEKTNLANYIREYRQFIAPTTIDPEIDYIVERTEGIHFWDTEGEKYTDWDDSVATVPLGHGHPIILEGRRKQMVKLDTIEASARHYQFTITVDEKNYLISPIELAKKLVYKTFPEELGKVVFCERGAVAVHAAIMFLQRQRPERTHFFAFDGAFHGRIGHALALTCSKPIQKKNYTPGIHVTHLPLPRRESDMQWIERQFLRISMENTNAVFLEAIQGEGGIEEWNPIYWKRLQNFFKEKKIYIVADEIQCGLGRTGKMWGYEHFNIKPDIVIAGKGLGSGSEIAVIIYREGIETTPLENGWLAGTFPGNPAAITDALLTLAVIEDEKLIDRAAELGEYFSQKLHYITKDDTDGPHCILKGRGLMRGIEFRNAKSPDPIRRNMVLKKLKQMGIATLPCGHDEINPTIRFVPPLIINKKDINDLMEALYEALDT